VSDDATCIRHQYGRAVFEYVSRDLRGEIGRFVESIWFARGHIIRDFKRHAGVTPSESVAAQRST